MALGTVKCRYNVKNSSIIYERSIKSEHMDVRRENPPAYRDDGAVDLNIAGFNPAQ